MTKKKTNATDDEKLHNLTNADWKFLNKMLCKHSESIVNTVNNFTCETFDSLWGRSILIEHLLCTLYELQGINPIEACEMMRLHYVYHHNSFKSDVPGMEIKAGKLFGRDGKEIPMDFVYQAKKKGVEFHKVVNAYYYKDEAEDDQQLDNDEPEYYQHFDNDEANEESSKSDDEKHRASQALEMQAQE
jgi:hypothetical protein